VRILRRLQRAPLAVRVVVAVLLVVFGVAPRVGDHDVEGAVLAAIGTIGTLFVFDVFRVGGRGNEPAAVEVPTDRSDPARNAQPER
jgi:hypothetical protein